MKTRLPTGRERLSTAALILGNLVPLGGVLFAHWDAATIVLLYWAENLIVGGYNVLRLALAKAAPPFYNFGKLFVIPFFCVHYGGFCAVHGMFLLFFFKVGNPGDVFPHGHWMGPLVFIQLLVGVVTQLWRHMPQGMVLPVAALAASHGVSFVQHYLLDGGYARATVKDLMARPYKRIVLMHVTIIAGAFFVMTFRSPLPLLIIMVLLKTGLDGYFHVRALESPGKDGQADEG